MLANRGEIRLGDIGSRHFPQVNRGYGSEIKNSWKLDQKAILSARCESFPWFFVTLLLQSSHVLCSSMIFKWIKVIIVIVLLNIVILLMNAAFEWNFVFRSQFWGTFLFPCWWCIIRTTYLTKMLECHFVDLESDNS